MVGKSLGSAYQRARSNDWRKIKYAGYSRPDALGWGRKQ
jgi:bifunctional non-homologous end joining protein LigD